MYAARGQKLLACLSQIGKLKPFEYAYLAKLSQFRMSKGANG